MGASHASRVYATWGDLPDRPFRLLVHMALVVPDSHTKPRYFGGRDAMAIALGMDPASHSAKRMVMATVSRLVEAGALAPDGNTGFRGRRKEYELTLERVTPESPKTPRKGDSGVRERVTPESEKGDSNDPERVTVESPQGIHRSTRSESEEEISSTKVSTEGAVAGNSEDGDLSQFEARRIIRENTDDNGHALRKSAPLTIPRDQIDVWCARQILARRETA